MNKELEKLQQRGCLNKLTINLTKYYVLIIPSTLRRTAEWHLDILSAGTSVKVVDSAKYLGVMIDNYLDFKQHITVLECNVARAVGIMSKLKSVFPQANPLQLYYALVHPLLLYGLIIRGSTYFSYLNKLKILQSKAIRIVSGGHHRDTAMPIHAKLKILLLEDLYKFETGKFVYNRKGKAIPRPFHNYFATVNLISARSTR